MVVVVVYVDCLCVSLPLVHFIEEDSYAPVEAMGSKSVK